MSLTILTGLFFNNLTRLLSLYAFAILMMCFCFESNFCTSFNFKKISFHVFIFELIFSKCLKVYGKNEQVLLVSWNIAQNCSLEKNAVTFLLVLARNKKVIKLTSRSQTVMDLVVDGWIGSCGLFTCQFKTATAW